MKAIDFWENLNFRKITQLKTDSKTSISKSLHDEIIGEMSARIDELEDQLREEKYGRIADQRDFDRKMKNLQGHMINIYTGNIPPEMAKMLDGIVKLKLRDNNNDLNNNVHSPTPPVETNWY